MSKVKFKRIQEQTIEELENEINQYLASEEGSRYLNFTLLICNTPFHIFV
jgi:hypothetical protein